MLIKDAVDHRGETVIDVKGMRASMEDLQR